MWLRQDTSVLILGSVLVWGENSTAKTNNTMDDDPTRLFVECGFFGFGGGGLDTHGSFWLAVGLVISSLSNNSGCAKQHCARTSSGNDFTKVSGPLHTHFPKPPSKATASNVNPILFG
jgi:hypothetical protein